MNYTLMYEKECIDSVDILEKLIEKFDILFKPVEELSEQHYKARFGQLIYIIESEINNESSNDTNNNSESDCDEYYTIFNNDFYTNSLHRINNV